VPLSAFRYAERTREPLLVEDATVDDRFARDPYITGLGHCSLLIVPILHQGKLRAMLLLENRLSRGAFSTGRLEAVSLIAGQLAVSLENALLYDRLEQRVREQTDALREAQDELVAAARRAGMAEIATNVLHNVGNILTSVNASASQARSKLHGSSVHDLTRAVRLMDQHGERLAEFLTRDERGKLLPRYLGKLSEGLVLEQQDMLRLLNRLSINVDHIMGVVATQQSYAGRSSVLESVQLRTLVDDALRMNDDSLGHHNVIVVKELADVPAIQMDKTRVMQILVNLIRNAKQAMQDVSDRPRRMTLRMESADGYLRLLVKDTGCGILPDNLARIFSHGFTTRKEGHGFGLHSCALAAAELGGTLTAESEGADRGATFTLQLPIEPRPTPANRSR
jgi:C4-dicarboxylate-specific signal transduction histidine kinase